MFSRSPGNWTVVDRQTAGEGYAVVSDHDFEGAPGTTHNRFIGQIMQEDDAMLLAAAPEMYEALEAVAITLRGNDLYDLTKVDLALAKARGETI